MLENIQKLNEIIQKSDVDKYTKQTAENITNEAQLNLDEMQGDCYNAVKTELDILLTGMTDHIKEKYPTDEELMAHAEKLDNYLL